MQTTGIFTIHEYVIPFEKYDEPIYITPFGDIHRSAPLCHAEKWLEYLAWAKTKKRCYFLGMGDYDDLASSSERDILSNRNLHDSTKETLEGLYNKHITKFAKEIAFMKGKLIGLIEGNHYAEFPDGTTSTQRLCRLMETKYLGASSFIRITLTNTKRGSQGNRSIDIWAHHGKGAARLVGGSLNRVQQMAEAAEADIYLMGHDHKKAVASTTRLRLKQGNGEIKLSHRKMYMIRTGSFLKAYVPDKVSYVVDMAASPTDLGVVKIELTPKRDQKGDEDKSYIDIHASL